MGFRTTSSIGWEGGGIETAKRSWKPLKRLEQNMRSQQRAGYEFHLTAATRHLAIAANALEVAQQYGGADDLRLLVAWLHSDVERSLRHRPPNRLPVNLTGASASSPGLPGISTR